MRVATFSAALIGVAALRAGMGAPFKSGIRRFNLFDVRAKARMFCFAVGAT